MSNVWRAENSNGELLRDFSPREFNVDELATDFPNDLPILVKDLGDTRATGITRFVGSILRRYNGPIEFVPTR